MKHFLINKNMYVVAYPFCDCECFHHNFHSNKAETK
ncbi:hypothetical protein MUK42_37545 [Musa troglodytarum]|uniref:Uncharacterized protein n=1 Tax=Musa troglodytarum TaxID=320322 RepID=A0A9E7JB34_9LILI|nr:hypothetical protein MUK42_37545 [Musa troglodytarum]